MPARLKYLSPLNLSVYRTFVVQGKAVVHVLLHDAKTASPYLPTSQKTFLSLSISQGLCVVLENRLSHPLMRELLPALHNHLHDTSEKVRIAFLDLLLLVKGMRMVKFWQVCPVEHLLGKCVRM